MNFCDPSLFSSLSSAQQQLAQTPLIDLFKKNPQRAEDFTLNLGPLFLDYSKNLIDSQTLELLLELPKTTLLKQKIEGLFTGKLLNTTEARPALHTVLRQQTDQPILVNGENIIPELRAAQRKMQAMATQIREQKWLGSTSQPITDVVNIGVGGSDLGPLLATQALKNFTKDCKVNLHFISNIDPEPLLDLFATLNPETTLFIIASKSFTTQETFVNANVARDWIVQTLGAKAIEKHFVAITAHVKKALTYGLLEENILPLWDWVGGRYSLWSTIGLSIAISIGMEHFVQFLQGAEEMDQHFYSAPFEQNMPIILALLGIWYINFFNIHTQAIIPYSEALRSLPHYLQQLDMESNGKSVDQQGHKITYNTAPIIWGAVGTNSQHACHQLFHQGPHFLPIDFIIPLKPSHPLQANQDILFANCLAQAEALMLGKTENEAYDELIFTGMDPIQAKSLAKHKSIQGSKPSNLLLLDDISPRSIGALIALYEHKVFVQGVIWNINSFDQWGVELGKQLGHKILDVIHHKTDLASQDPSTQNLLKKYRKSFSS